MKAKLTADPGALSLLHHRYVSRDIIQALSTLGLRQSTCHICSWECRPGQERKKAGRGHCVTTERGIFFFCFRSRLVWGWPNFFFFFILFILSLSLSSTSINSFSRRVSPQGSQSGLPTLLLLQMSEDFSVMQSSRQKQRNKRKRCLTTFPKKNEWRKIIRNELRVWVSGKTSIRSNVSEQP